MGGLGMKQLRRQGKWEPRPTGIPQRSAPQGEADALQRPAPQVTLRCQSWAPASVRPRGKELGVVGMEVACARGQVRSWAEITGASYKSLWGHAEKNSVKSADAQLRKGPATQVLGPVMSGTMSD